MGVAARIFLLAVTWAAAIPAQAGEFKAGVATAEITPPVGVPMWGYAVRHDAPSRAIRDPLFARALVLAEGSTKVLIVSVDLGRPPTRMHMAAIRQRLSTLGIQHVLVVASHTHHGPILEVEDVPDARSPYTRWLDDRICELAIQADRASMPARLGASVKLCDLNRNRQSRLAGAPVDQTLSVIRVETREGTAIATLVNFAAHPTMLDAKLMEFSAEWPGAMAKRVQAATGAPCLFLQGASGDLSPKLPKPGTFEDFGAALADEVIDLSAKTQCVGDRLDLRGVREEVQFRCLLKISDPLVKFSLQSVFFQALVAHYEREYREGVRAEVSTVLLTDQIGLVGFSGEMFCGHALSLRRRARVEHLMVCGYCNDYQQYFPTIEAIAEGGYGTAPPVANAEAGAGEHMTDRALMQLFKLRGQFP